MSSRIRKIATWVHQKINESYPATVQVAVIAIASRVVMLLMMMGFHLLITDHICTDPFVLVYDTKFALLPFVRWDAARFLRIAEFGYETTDQFALFPGYPLLIRSITAITGMSFEIAGLLTSFTAFLIAALGLLRLATNRMGEKKGKLAAVLYCINPASTFFSTCYSEALFSALYFWMLVFLDEGWVSLAFCNAACASAVRFNASSFWPLFIGQTSVFGFIFMCFAAWMPNILHQVRAWMLLCPGEGFCNRIIPLVYPYVQDHYWDVGPFRYFLTPYGPAIALLGLPMLILAGLNGKQIYYETKDNPKSAMSWWKLNMLEAHFIVTVLTVWIGAHVIIVNRAVASSCAGFYMFIARNAEGSDIPRWYLIWSFAFAVIGAGLHSNNFPWV